jgi:PmbA protein
MKDSSQVFELSNKCFNYIKHYDSTLISTEFYFELSEYLSIEIDENSIKHSEIGSDEGISVRIIGKNGSAGFSFTNRLDWSNIERIIKEAFKMMKAGTEDPDFVNLPFPHSSYPKVNNLYDPEIENLSVEESANYFGDLIKVCDEDELAISQSGNFSTNLTHHYIFNSNGIEVGGKETTCSLSSNVIVKDKISKETSFGFDYQSSRFLNRINPIKIINTALNRAKQNLNRIEINNMRCPVILTPNGVISLILKPLASAINAEAFQHKRTFLVGLKETKIGSKDFNIEDNGLIDGEVGSAPFDAEGVPCHDKKIIKNGIFLKSGLLHNSYTANKEGIESTGNASRHSFASIPGIGISNFILNSGSTKKAEIIKSVDKGILLDYTGDRPNISTGDFSGLILHGNLIQNGKIESALNETMIGINLLDLFSKIEMISKENQQYGPFQAPFVKIEDVQIIGSKS